MQVVGVKKIIITYPIFYYFCPVAGVCAATGKPNYY